MRTASLITLAILAFPGSAHAQKVGTAPGWAWQHDRTATPQGATIDPRDTAWTFVSMAPGWHVTTGPGSTLFDARNVASGRYTLSSEIFLFSNPTEEGYGILFGGSGLGTDSAAYAAVLLRHDGAVSVQSFRAGAVTVIAPWTRHAAIKPNPGDQIVENHLRLHVGSDSLRVFVNDSSVLTVARGGLATDGQFGLRVGRGLNLHVTTLDHTVHLAPVPR